MRKSTIGSISLAFFIATVLAGLVPLAVHAVAPAGGSGEAYEVDLRGATVSSLVSSNDPSVRNQESWRAFLRRNPGWEARWDAGRDVPVRLEGRPRPIPGFGSVDAGNAEQAARAFLRGEASAWIPESDLVLERVAADRKGFWVHFQQTRDGVPVWDSGVSLRVGGGGVVSTVLNHAQPDLPALASPRLAQAVALEQARSGLPGAPEPAGEPKIVCLPIPRDGRAEARLAWLYQFRTTDPPGNWFAFVDAESGGLLWRVNRVSYAQVSGTISGQVERVKADGNFQELPFSLLNATLEVGGSPEQTVQTDAEGGYSFTTTAMTGRSLRAPLEGPYGKIIDMDDGEATPAISAPVPDGATVTLDLSFTDAAADPSARDVFYHAGVARNRIKALDPAFTGLDYQVPLRVDVNGVCNAFWDGYALNFYAEGGGCANFGRIGDVVYHEYGHGISQHVYDPDWPADFLGEAFSDYFAVSITGSPCIGPDATSNPCIRDLSVPRVYPQDWDPEPHTASQILSSALWDMRQALGGSVSDELFYAAMGGRAQTFDDYFFEVLRADDDDEDVYNGTPDLTSLASVFRAHGIGDYSIHVVHDPQADSEDTTQVIPLVVSFNSIYAIDPATVHLHFAVTHAGVTRSVDTLMTPTGEPREYRVTLPRQRAETTVSYYFSASDTSGGTVSLPGQGAADPFVFHIGADTTPPWITHEVVEPQPATMPVWRVQASAGDNLDLPLHSLTLTWKRNHGGTAQVPMTALGDDRYVAEVNASGFAPGDLIEYRIEAEDAAAVPNHAVVPSAGFYSFRLVDGWLKDFEADNGGLNGNSGNREWQWGVPDPAMGTWSGTKVWATNLHGTYQGDSRYVLELPSLNLSGAPGAALTFRHRYMSEPGYDGGYVEASTDAGVSWTVIRPDGDYPVPHLDVSGTPAYSGVSSWEEARFDLFSFLGASDCRIRLVFVSDPLVIDRGWVVDDLAFVKRQIEGRPLHLTATQGEHGKVSLAWSIPAGLPEEGPTPVRGYNVWRRIDGTDSPAVINPALLSSTLYTDTAVVNGTKYWYYATAVYDSAESAPSVEGLGWPYEQTLLVPFPAISAQVDSGATVPATLSVQNSGTGLLGVNLYPAAEGQSINDVRLVVETAVAGKTFLPPIVMEKNKEGAEVARIRPGLPVLPATPVDPEKLVDAATLEGPATPVDPATASARVPAEPRSAGSEELLDTWIPLAVDADERTDPDLKWIEVAQDDTMLKFRLSSYRPWGDPTTDFSFRIGIELDNNVEAGAPPGGFDALILAGARAITAYHTLGLLLYAGPGGNTVGAAPLDVLDLAAGDSVAVFGVSKAALGWPQRVTVQFMVKNADYSVYLDAVPDFVDLPWLLPVHRHAVIEAGSPQDLAFQLGSPGLDVGEYAAQVFVTSDDEANPFVPVPVHLTVEPQNTPVYLNAFTAESAEEGVVLHWSINSSAGQAPTLVYRTEISPEPGEEVLLTDEAVLSPSAGEARYLDRTAEAGAEYEYRLEAQNPDGTRETAGRLRVIVTARALPRAVTLDGPWPNPTGSGAGIRFGLPRSGIVLLDVVGADGRKVRTLIDREARGAGWHTFDWDGRNDAGRETSSGSYFLRLRANGRECSQKVVVLRR